MFLLYRRLPVPTRHEVASKPVPLGPSKRTAIKLAAPVVARRIGLLNTMVFTHIPANLALIAAPLVACGILKIAYDLAIWRAFRRISLDDTMRAQPLTQGS